MSAELEIPASTLNALVDTGADIWNDDAEIAEDARIIAAPVVVAELRRLANHFETSPGLQPRRVGRGVDAQQSHMRDGIELIIAALRARADELDPS